MNEDIEKIKRIMRMEVKKARAIKKMIKEEMAELKDKKGFSNAIVYAAFHKLAKKITKMEREAIDG